MKGLRHHGQLLAGDPGSYAVELAACWAIVVILSGLFLLPLVRATMIAVLLVERFVLRHLPGP